MVARDGMTAAHRLLAALAVLAAMAQFTSEFSVFKRDQWSRVQAVMVHAKSLLEGWMPPASGSMDSIQLWWTLVGRLDEYSMLCANDLVAGQRWAEHLVAGADVLFDGDAVRTLTAACKLMRALPRQSQFDNALSVCAGLLPHCRRLSARRTWR